MQKKGDLSINIIVVAALAVLTLVIISVIFMSRMGNTTRNINDCEAVEGRCMDRICDDGYKSIPKVCYGSDGQPDSYQRCCIRLDV